MTIERKAFNPKTHPIVTVHVFPPIPVRDFDWCAHYDGREEISSEYGWGKTEDEAIEALRHNFGIS